MNDWTEKKLEDLVRIDPVQINGTFDASHPFYYLDISSVSSGRIQFPTFPIYLKDAPSRARKVLVDGDVLMSTVRPNLRSFAKFNSPDKSSTFIASTGFAVLSKREGTDLEYIYHFLFSNSLERQIESLVVGSNYPAINTSDVRNLRILLPDSPLEQTRIAEILNAADEGIAQSEALIAKYRRIKMGLMQDLLTRGIDEHGNVRNKATHEFVVTKGIEAPEDWEVAPLGHFLTYISYGFINPMPEAPEGPFMVTARNINEGRIVYENCRHTSQKAFDTLLTNKSRPKLGDILVTKDGTLGRIAIVEQENLCINQSVAVLRPNPAKVDRYFLRLLLESPYYQEKMLGEAGGSTIKHIYISKLDRMLIAMPSNKDERSRIRDAIDRTGSFLTKLKAHLTKLQSMRTGLMQDLLSGTKRVTLGEHCQR